MEWKRRIKVLRAFTGREKQPCPSVWHVFGKKEHGSLMMMLLLLKYCERARVDVGRWHRRASISSPILYVI